MSELTVSIKRREKPGYADVKYKKAKAKKEHNFRSREEAIQWIKVSMKNEDELSTPSLLSLSLLFITALGFIALFCIF